MIHSKLSSVKTSNRSLFIKGTILITVILTIAAWLIYKDSSHPPKLSTEFFSELNLKQSAQAIADATTEGGAPGALVLIRKDGQDTIATSGISNKQTGGKMPKNKALRIGSVSKVYTATIILSLANRGLIDLDANIVDYLSPEMLNGVPNAKQATVRQLLLHTSGIPDYYDLRSYFLQDWTQAITLDRMLPVAKRGSSNFVAGERFEYSNTGYILLGELAETVTGKSLTHLIEETITQPLKFSKTYYNVQHPEIDGIHGYGTIMRPWADTYDLWEHSGPDSGIMANASETAQFLEALTLDNGKLKDIGDQMLKETVKSANRTRQGLGLEAITNKDGEVVLFGHTGDVFGYQTVAFSHPDSGSIFVAHINCDCSALSASLISNLYRAVNADK